jgi:hypothetical protein
MDTPASEDPLVGVARQIGFVAALKPRFPRMLIVGTGYTCRMAAQRCPIQRAQRAVDFVGIGRMALAYPVSWRFPGRQDADRSACAALSATAPARRSRLVSGCYPLDEYYKGLPEAETLQQQRKRRDE